MRRDVLEVMLPYLSDHFGNPSSIHWAGRAVSGAVETAREQVAALLGASPAEIVFTSCGSEGNNFALKGVARALADKGRHIITTSVEHPSVLESCRALENDGWLVTYLPVDEQCQLCLSQLEQAITDQTVLITVMWANNETGAIFPISEIGAIARRNNITFHTDAVQAIGRVSVDVQQTNLDLLALSGHKFGAPKGVGALYIRSGQRLEQLIHGGHQERNRRAGTHNVAGIVALGKASELALKELDAVPARIRKLRDRLESGLFERIPNIKLNGPADASQRLPNTLNLSFSGIEGESLLLNLDIKGIAGSSGSACSSGTLEPSHVMKAMGIEPLLAQSSLRLSLGPDNSAAEIERVLTEIPAIVARLRSISPLDS